MVLRVRLYCAYLDLQLNCTLGLYCISLVPTAGTYGWNLWLYCAHLVLVLVGAEKRAERDQTRVRKLAKDATAEDGRRVASGGWWVSGGWWAALRSGHVASSRWRGVRAAGCYTRYTPEDGRLKQVEREGGRECTAEGPPRERLRGEA